MKKAFSFIIIGLFFITNLVFANSHHVLTGYGWAVDGLEADAVHRAASMMKKTVKHPEFIIVYTTVGYRVDKVLSNLRKEIGKKAMIFGLTSSWGVITRDGVHVGKKASLAMMGVSSPAIRFGVDGASIGGGDDVTLKAADSIENAVLRAGKPEGSIPDMVLMAASPGIEESVLKGVESVFGKKVPVYGGSAADNSISGKWRVFNNNESYSNGFSLAVVFTDMNVGHAFHSGYLGSEKSGVATRVKGGESRTLLEIDGKPAAEVYNNWAYDKYENEVRNGGNILGPSSFYPLARRIVTEGKTHYIGIHPAEIARSTKSLGLFANVKEGVRLYFTEGTENALIYRPRTISRRALLNGRIQKEKAKFGLFIYCGGTMMAVQKRVPEIVPIINKTLGQTPYIGAFTFGEQGNIKNYGNFHGNLMSSMVILGEK